MGHARDEAHTGQGHPLVAGREREVGGGGGGGLKRNEKEMYHPVVCTSYHSSERIY